MPDTQDTQNSTPTPAIPQQTDVTSVTPTQPTPANNPTQQTQPVTTPNTSSNPTAPTAPNQPAAQQKPSLHARIFDGILKGMTGGDRKVVNPDGSVSTIPSSRAGMGRAIIAAALTGLMTPDHFRQTPYGPVRDYSADAAGAFQASKGAMEQYREAPQKLSDEQQARKLQFLQNNTKLLQLKLSSLAMQHKNMEDSKPIIADALKPFEDYQAEKQSSDPDWFLKRGLTHEQALAEAKTPGSGITEANFIQDGWMPAGSDPDTKQQLWQPSYAIVNPKLSDVKLPENVAKRLSEINSQYQDIHKLVGGDVRLPASMYVSAMHDYEAVKSGEDILDRLNESLHPQDAKDGKLKPMDISSIVRNSPNRQALLKALYDIHGNIAGGMSGLGGKTTTASGATMEPGAEGETPEGALRVILKSAPELLKPLGLTTAEAEDKINDWKAQQQQIKNIGTPKAPAEPQQVTALKTAVAGLSDKDQKEMAPLMKDTMSVGDIKNAQARLAGINARNESNVLRAALNGGDPTAIATFSKNVVENGNVNTVKDLPPRGNSRILALNKMQEDARLRGMDANKFDDSHMQAKSDLVKEIESDKRGTQGNQIQSFNQYLGHSAAAYDALERLKNKTLGPGGLPVWNQAEDVLAKQLANDADWKAYETALQPVRQEFQNFLSNGYAVKEEDQKAIDSILNKHETPERIFSALRQMADTADVRLQSMGSKYVGVMDNTYQNLLSPEAAQTLKRFGLQSKAAYYSGNIPKGWQNNQATPVTDKGLARQLFEAAGRDKQKAIYLAKQNGWLLQ